MRLSEVLTDESNYDKIFTWLSDYQIEDGDGDELYTVEKFIDKYIDVPNMKLRSRSLKICLFCSEHTDHIDFKWILDKNVGKNTFVIGAGEAYENSTMTLNSFDDLPNAVELDLGLMTIKSFAGIEKMKVKDLVLTGDLKLECGLLRLLKANLDSLSWENMDEKEDEMYSIISNAIHHKKTIPECQQELIEAGFKKYAKL